MECLNQDPQPSQPSGISDPGSSTAWGIDTDWQANPNSWNAMLDTHEAARFLLDKVDWEQKRKRCESLHEPQAKCEILPSWIVGTRHRVRKAVFADGSKWVIKLPLPEDLTPSSMTKSNSGNMRLEYETHSCFQSVILSFSPSFFSFKDWTSLGRLVLYEYQSYTE